MTFTRTKAEATRLRNLLAKQEETFLTRLESRVLQRLQQKFGTENSDEAIPLQVAQGAVRKAREDEIVSANHREAASTSRDLD